MGADVDATGLGVAGVRGGDCVDLDATGLGGADMEAAGVDKTAEVPCRPPTMPAVVGPLLVAT